MFFLFVYQKSVSKPEINGRRLMVHLIVISEVLASWRVIRDTLYAGKQKELISLTLPNRNRKVGENHDFQYNCKETVKISRQI